MTKQFTGGVALAIMIAASFGASGDSSAAPAPSSAAAAPVQAVIACRSIAVDAQRLACFDKAVAAMGEAQTKGDLVTLDREQRRTVRRQAFGLSLPAFNLFDRGEKAEDVDRLTGTIASAREDGFGKWTVRLQDGAVWVQTDDSALGRPPHAGSTVVISKGVLGSFFMKIDGQQAVRARRQL
jgi:hypothetical protein